MGRSREDRTASAGPKLTHSPRHARLVRIVEHALERDEWVGHGIHTPTQWVALRAGVSPNRARQIVRVAQRRSSFPLVFAAFDTGELTLDQVAEVVPTNARWPTMQGGSA